MHHLFSYLSKPFLAFILLVSLNSSAQVSTNSEATNALINDLGISKEEKQCIQNLDRKCLFEYYRSGLPGNPLQAMEYNDTFSWKHMALSFRNAAGQFYERNPHTCIDLYKRIAIFFSAADIFKQSNYGVQSIGFLYDEQLHKHDSSMYFINLALQRWEQKKDTVNTANLYKYRAYLSSHLNRYETGKRDAHKAIMLYTAKGVQDGVMVSYRDLSTIFIKEKQFDSANHYLGKAKAHWISKNDTFRIATINTDLIKANASNSKTAKALLAENDQYMERYKMPKVAAISYYDAAINYAHAAGNKTQELKYTALRKKLED